MRVIQLGYGAVGKENIRQLLNRGHEVVGIVDRREILDAIDLGGFDFKGRSPLLTDDLGECLARSKPDILLQATVWDPDDMIRVIGIAADAKCDVISINPIVDIRQIFPETYAELDRIAIAGGIRVLGVGAVPGFFSDVLPLVLSGVCADVSSVRFRRCADFSKWGPSVLEKFGFGLTAEAFREGTKAGKITLFRSLWQSAHLIAAELGWPILEKEDIREPLVSDRARTAVHMTTSPGTVGGFRHRVVIHSTEGRTIDLQVAGFIDPKGIEEETAMAIEILGEPQMRVEVSGGVLLSSGSVVSSSARIINSIAALASGKPGVRTTADLRLISGR